MALARPAVPRPAADRRDERVTEADHGFIGRVLEEMAQRRMTLAVAESLTGGLVCSRIVEVPGASRVLRGGVVAYANAVKARVCGVDPALLADQGPVDPEVVQTMAMRTAQMMGADVGIGTTGVAGPDPQGGKPVGTVFIAVVTPGPGLDLVRGFNFAGDREQIRERTVAETFRMLCEVVRGGECDLL